MRRFSTENDFEDVASEVKQREQPDFPKECGHLLIRRDCNGQALQWPGKSLCLSEPFIDIRVGSLLSIRPVAREFREWISFPLAVYCSEFPCSEFS